MNRQLWAAVALVVVAASAWCQPIRPGRITDHPIDVSRFFCGREGSACCHAPESIREINGPLVHCNAGLGCDVVTDTCVSPCGAAGQVCCDGPDTNAPRWKDNGRVEVPTGFLVRQMCLESVCNPIARRCMIGCGHEAGQACCPPQPAIGIATCIGTGLYCDFAPGSSSEAGICRQCGKPYQESCGGSCEGRFTDDSNDICVPCGPTGQLACDGPPDCDDERATPGPGRICVICGIGGDPACRFGKPCRRPFLAPDAAGICRGTQAIGMPCGRSSECREGICGQNGKCRWPQPPPCGALHQPGCTVPPPCREGVLANDGFCRPSSSLPPRQNKCCCRPGPDGFTQCGCWPSFHCP
jgi:hypothetical protein